MSKLEERLMNLENCNVVDTDYEGSDYAPKIYVDKMNKAFYRSHFFNIEVLCDLLKFLNRKNLSFHCVGLAFVKGNSKDKVILKISYIESGIKKHAIIAHYCRETALREFKYNAKGKGNKR